MTVAGVPRNLKLKLLRLTIVVNLCFSPDFISGQALFEMASVTPERLCNHRRVMMITKGDLQNECRVNCHWRTRIRK